MKAGHREKQSRDELGYRPAAGLDTQPLTLAVRFRLPQAFLKGL